MILIVPPLRQLTVASKAQALKTYSGVEIVRAKLDEPASVEEAMRGAYGVYGVTNFWEHGYDGEVRQGKTLVDAAKKAGVKHFIWSTFDHSEQRVPHFESKWEVDGTTLTLINLEYLKQSGVPRTSLYTAFYIENIRESMKTIKSGDTYTLPMTILPDGTLLLRLTIAKSFMYPVDDTGAWVTAAFSNPETWIGKDMRLVTEWLSTREMAAIASRVSGKKVLPMELDQAAFEAPKHTGNPLDEELWRSKLFAVKVGLV